MREFFIVWHIFIFFPVLEMRHPLHMKALQIRKESRWSRGNLPGDKSLQGRYEYDRESSYPPLIHGARQWNQSCNSSLCPKNKVSLEGPIGFVFDCCNLWAFLECSKDNVCVCWSYFNATYNSSLMQCVVPPGSECVDFKNDDISLCTEKHGCWENCTEEINESICEPICHKCPKSLYHIQSYPLDIINNVEQVCYISRERKRSMKKFNLIFVLILGASLL